MNGIFQAFPDKIRMRNNQVSLNAGMRIDFARDGRTHSVKPAFGPAFADMVGQLRETGGMQKSGAAGQRIVSDDVTVLRSGETDAAVLLGFMTGDDQLFETVVEVDENHRCTGLCCACVYDALLPDGAQALSGLRVFQRHDPGRPAIWGFD